MAPDGLLSHHYERRNPVTRQHRGPIPIIPEGFLSEVRAIVGGADVHIPKAFRDGLTANFCDCLEGALEGDEGWGHLLESLTKLVLYGIPGGSTADAEIASRLALWEQGRLADLLQRIRTQAAGRADGVARTLDRKRVGAAEARALRLAREGAKSKACSGLLGGVKTLSPEEQRQWAAKLFPRMATQPAPSGPSAAPSAPVSASAAAQRGDAPMGGVATSRSNSLDVDGDPQWAQHPLKGVHFRPMTGTGPSNCRPEHVKEMMATRKRALRRRLLTLLEKGIEMGLDGDLPNSMRWILGSAATFLDKPGREAPRPIRCGEWFRKAISKVLLRRHRVKIQQVMLELQQFGVMIPGGAEALYHARVTIEELADSGSLGPLVAVDVDLVNFFGSVEWAATKDAYRDLFPEGLAWESWCQAEPVSITLPCREQIESDRGAGQGEPDGPLKASLPLGRAMREARSDLQERCRMRFAQGWYMDDGQVFCRPDHLDTILRRMDAGFEAIGATRGSLSQGDDIKSTVKAFGLARDAETTPQWGTDYVRDTCKVRDASSATKLLGGALGPAAHHAAVYAASVAKTSALHDAIGGVPDAATQMSLRTACADVSKVAYILRLAGDQLQPGDLAELGKIQRAGVGATLYGDVGDDAWEQATTTEIGLGLRSAEELSLPAFISSRVASRSVAARMFRDLEEAGLAPANVLLNAYDARLEAAVTAFEASLPDDAVIDSIHSIINAGLRASEQSLDRLVGGHEDNTEPADSSMLGRGLVFNDHGDADEADDDAQLHSQLHRQPKLQRAITRKLDHIRLQRLRDRMAGEGLEEDVRRLDDLMDTPAQEHTWWRSLNPQTDKVLPEEEWVIAMRVRLGAPVLPADGICGYCGAQRMDARGYHALCCALGESTKGHNRVRDVLADCCGQADPSTAVEVLGLCPRAPTLRPADILTGAVHPTLTVAVDVGVKAPHAADAGDNPVESMRAAKLERYADHLHDLETQGIVYEPIIVSCYGRWHPRATQMLNHAAARAARRNGYANGRGLSRRWRRQIAAELWFRAARMIIACYPRRVATAPGWDVDDDLAPSVEDPEQDIAFESDLD